MLTGWDYSILGLFAAALLAAGIWARRGQQASDDLLLAGRALAWWAMGLSLVLAGLMAAVYCTAPNDGYFLGARYLVLGIFVWPALPLACWCTLPLYTRLGLESVYEYLELRFGPATRAAGAGLYLAGQLCWLAGLLALGCRVLRLEELSGLPPAAWLIGAGALVTLYTFLGGMKASVWTDILQLGLAAGAAVVLVAAIGGSLPNGLPRIWEVAEKLGRSTVLDSHFDPAATWCAWVAAPAVTLLGLYFLSGDQAALQRFFAGRYLLEMKLAALVGCVGASLLVPVAMYIGLGLLALYHDRAQQEVPPIWVANLAEDPQTGRPRLDPATPITAENVERLAEQGLILDPNTLRPFEDTRGLINSRGEVVVDRLATRAPPPRGGERYLRRGHGRLLGHFVAGHLMPGLLGLVVAAFVGVAMAAVDSGLVAMATVLVVDFHRRFGLGSQWLAERCSKPAEALDQTDELQIARPLILLVGLMVTLLSLVGCRLDDLPRATLAALGATAGPLGAVFLLGIFTRRATAGAVLLGMASGVVAALYAALGHRLPGLWPLPGPLGAFWPTLVGFGVALLVGAGISLVPQRRKTAQELEGLVVGLGRLGVLPELAAEATDEVIWLDGGTLEPLTQGAEGAGAAPGAHLPPPAARTPSSADFPSPSVPSGPGGSPPCKAQPAAQSHPRKARDKPSPWSRPVDG